MSLRKYYNKYIKNFISIVMVHQCIFFGCVLKCHILGVEIRILLIIL